MKTYALKNAVGANKVYATRHRGLLIMCVAVQVEFASSAPVPVTPGEGHLCCFTVMSDNSWHQQTNPAE